MNTDTRAPVGKGDNRMRTIGKTSHYCAHCGFDLPNGDEDHSIMCPACDGDICKPKRRVVAKKSKPVRPIRDETTERK